MKQIEKQKFVLLILKMYAGQIEQKRKYFLIESICAYSVQYGG